MTDIADDFLIATVNNARQSAAIVDECEKERKTRDLPCLGIEGKGNSTWVVLDYGDLVVHLFTPEAREYYRIEHVWRTPKDGPTASRPPAWRTRATPTLTTGSLKVDDSCEESARHHRGGARAVPPAVGRPPSGATRTRRSHARADSEGVVCHGLLATARISSFLARHFIGDQWLLMGVNAQFRSPVYWRASAAPGGHIAAVSAATGVGERGVVAVDGERVCADGQAQCLVPRG